MTPLPVLALSALLLTPASDLGRRPAPPDPGPAPGYGLVHQPAYSNDKRPRPPLEPYQPQPGDVLLLSNPTPLFIFLYKLAFAGQPGHSAVVVRMPDGRLGMLEAGVDSTPRTLVNPLDWRLHTYQGTIWVRRRTAPLTPAEDARLTEFAARVDGKYFAVVRFALQVTPLRSRGPLRTFLVGRSRPAWLPGRDYLCSEAVLEALVYAGLVDHRTARPSATYPADLFFDRSRNPYLDRHPPLAGGCWEVPRLWSRAACLDTSPTR